MRILYQNQIPNATIFYSTEDANRSWLDTLIDTRLSRFGRTLGVTAEWLKFNFSSPVEISYLGILAHNLTSSAIVVLQGNTTDSWTTPAYEQTITITNGIDVVVELTTPQTYAFWRLTMADTTNTAGYIQIGLIYLGDYIQLPWSDAGSSAIPLKTTSQTDISDGGQVYLDKGYFYKAPEFTFTDVSQADVVLLETFFRVVDIGIPFILLIWEDALTVEPALYCTLNEGISKTRSNITGGVYYNLKLSFRETK